MHVTHIGCCPPQAACLMQRGVLDGNNLVFCAPTSAGKSLVAEVLMLRRLLSEKRACLLVLPYVALCAEKVRLGWRPVGDPA